MTSPLKRSGFTNISEFMAGGSVYDYLHKQKGVFKLPSLLKVAIDVSKGMNYLHQNNIIHRDLKAANLLMDENEVRGFSIPYSYQYRSHTSVLLFLCVSLCLCKAIFLFSTYNNLYSDSADILIISLCQESLVFLYFKWFRPSHATGKICCLFFIGCHFDFIRFQHVEGWLVVTYGACCPPS